jgi:hypothetical protein
MVRWQGSGSMTPAHVAHLNNSWDRMNGNRLVLSLQAQQVHPLSQSEGAIPPQCPRGDGVGILITHLVILHSYWSTGFRDSRVATAGPSTLPLTS